METVFDLFIALLLVGFIAGGAMISADTVESDRLGAGGFPIIFAIFGLVMLGFNYLDQRRNPVKTEPTVFTKNGLKQAGLIALALLAYILVVPAIGFIISTFMLCFFVVRIVGYRKNLKSLLFSFLVTALLVVVFGKIFFIALPRGMGFIKEISYQIY